MTYCVADFDKIAKKKKFMRKMSFITTYYNYSWVELFTDFD